MNTRLRNNFINETTVALPDDFRGECLLKSERLFTKNIRLLQKIQQILHKIQDLKEKTYNTFH